MAPGPPFRPLAALLATGCLALAACAGTGSESKSPSDETTARDERPSMLRATTPGAAAAHAETSGAAGPAPDPAPTPQGSRPGRLLVYSAITGHVPLKDQTHDPADRYRSPTEREAARARSLEAEIEEELARQEQLGTTETSRAAAATPVPSDPASSPLTAPAAPELRQLPDTLFESEEVTIPAGQWRNPQALVLERRTLDVDHDGRPEEVRYVDPASGTTLRSEHDLDYDGRLDAWVTYQGGEPALRVLDTDGNGEPDAWERYADGRMLERMLDRDGDGVRDVFYRYRNEDLVEKLYDANNDGTTDKVEEFSDRRRVETREDRSLNGKIDTWTTYEELDGREVVTSIRRDSRDNGTPDVFETYQTRDGKTRLARKEEDLNGDGNVDVVSIYEDGKLVQRAISDEALAPL